MDTTTIAIIAAAIGVIVTPIYLVLLAKGVRSATDIRNILRRPPGERD